MGTIVDRSNLLFAGQPHKTFKEAFPQVKAIKFGYKEIGKMTKTTARGLSLETMRSVLRCSNSLCNEGGFIIDDELSFKVFHNQKQHHEGFVHCVGHEHITGRWNTRTCLNCIRYKVDVEYA